MIIEVVGRAVDVEGAALTKPGAEDVEFARRGIEVGAAEDELVIGVDGNVLGPIGKYIAFLLKSVAEEQEGGGTFGVDEAVKFIDGNGRPIGIGSDESINAVDGEELAFDVEQLDFIVGVGGIGEDKVIAAEFSGVISAAVDGDGAVVAESCDGV